MRPTWQQIDDSPKARARARAAASRSRLFVWQTTMTHVPLSIRLAKRNDIPGIVECANSSTSEEEEAGFGRPFSQRTFNDVGRLAVWRDPNGVYSDAAGEEEVIVAETEGRIVGYVT